MASTPQEPNSRSVKRQRRLRLGRLGRGIILRFILFAVLSLLLILAMVVYAAWRHYNDVQALEAQVAQWTATSVDTWLRQIDYSLVAVSDPALFTDPAETVETRLSTVLYRQTNLHSLILVDARAGFKGRKIVAVGIGGASQQADFSGEEWFVQALEQGACISSVDLRQAIPLATVACRIEKDGQPLGVIAARADLSWATSLLGRAASLPGAYAYLVDDQGHPILHPSSQFVYPQRVRTDIAGIRAAITGQAMPIYYQGLNMPGALVLGTYCPLGQAPWTVIVEQPLLQATQGLFPLGIGTIAILLLFVLASIVVGVYISRRVATPIAQLQEGASRLGRGEMDYRLDVRGRGELAELAAEFNRMAENVRASRADLERWSHELEIRIQERTQELSQALARQQQEAIVRENLLRTIREMSSPVLPILEGILVMPIVGTLDSERARRVVEDLLAGIERERARAIIIDITGLAVVDTAVANVLVQAAQAARILGAEPILVGITAAVAETLVQLGVEMRLRTAATLQEGLQIALGLQRRKVIPT